MEKISSVSALRNEEKQIKRLLNSLVIFCDEIVLIHDGACEDKTKEIVTNYEKKYGSIRFVWKELPFEGNPESMFVQGINLASNEWICIIAADEFLDKKGITELNKIKVSDFDMVKVIWPLWDGKKYIRYENKKIIRIFKKSKIKWFGLLGEKFSTSSYKVYDSKIVFHHKPTYVNYSIKNFFSRKHLPWIKRTALLRSCKKRLKKIPTVNYSTKEKNLLIQQIYVKSKWSFFIMFLVPFLTLFNELKRRNFLIKSTYSFKRIIFLVMFTTLTYVFITIYRTKVIFRSLFK